MDDLNSSSHNVKTFQKFLKFGDRDEYEKRPAVDFLSLNLDQRKERIQYLWNVARRYTNKLRVTARMQRMYETKLRELMIDDINEEADDELKAES